MAEWNAESERALNAIFADCIAKKMTKSELIMQVGPPTSKDEVEDGEMWTYELNDRGETTTSGYIGPFGGFSATTTTREDKSTYVIRFDKKGTMVGAKTFGPARGRFRFLRAR